MAGGTGVARGTIMRLLALVIVLLALLAGPMASTAEAVTLKDLIDLKKAGLSDAVLVALIDSDATVFQLSAAEVRTLRDAGFSDSLIISILGTSTRDRQMREAQAATAAAAQPLWTPPAQPPIDQPEPLPSTYVAMPMTSPVYVFVPSGPTMFKGRPASAKTAPVYWGWGGKPRPDGWKEKDQ
jgi:hypothetical protein